jgi:hypothetical protein
MYYLNPVLILYVQSANTHANEAMEYDLTYIQW